MCSMHRQLWRSGNTVAHASACRGELQFAVWPWAEAYGSTLKRAPRPRSPCHCIVRASIAVLALAACAAQAEPITFYKRIAPIVYQACAPCHRPGEPGPFPLLTYTDVRKHGQQIVSVVKRRYMPPWLPEAGYGDFQEERRLTGDQIRTIEDWVRQGAPAGSPADAPPLPKFVPGWQLGEPDVVIEAAAPYRLPAGGPDQYWNFVLPLLPQKEIRR